MESKSMAASSGEHLDLLTSLMSILLTLTFIGPLSGDLGRSREAGAGTSWPSPPRNRQCCVAGKGKETQEAVAGGKQLSETELERKL